MSLPLISIEDVRSKLRTVFKQNRKCSSIEIFSEFPQDQTQARHGLYINNLATNSRTPYSLGVNYGSNIYICEDGFLIYFVSFQGDELMDLVTETITNLVQDNDLFDGYHERDFTITQEYRNRAEYRTFTFAMKRMEIQ